MSRAKHAKTNYRPLILLTGLVIVLLLAIALVVSIINRGEQTPARTGPFIICLDPGHGGDDPGVVSEAGRQEKDDALALALAVEEKLLAMADPEPETQRDQVKVILTRYEDYSPTLEDRYTFANSQDATVFVSLHRNGGGGKGLEVWIQNEVTTEESKLGQALLDAIGDCGVNGNRGLRKGTPANSGADFAVNRGTEMPACLIELGFMDHEPDNALFDNNFDAYAQAIAEAIMTMRDML